MTCSPEPEIQAISTSATDIDKVQYLVLDSSYNGNGEVPEVQNVQCNATGGAFGLAIDGETAYTLEALSLIDKVSILFNNGKTSACAPFDDESTGDCSITFESSTGMAGDLPLLLTAETSGLYVARVH